jgi:hypothetical protein
MNTLIDTLLSVYLNILINCRVIVIIYYKWNNSKRLLESPMLESQSSYPTRIVNKSNVQLNTGIAISLSMKLIKMVKLFGLSRKLTTSIIGNLLIIKTHSLKL